MWKTRCIQHSVYRWTKLFEILAIFDFESICAKKTLTGRQRLQSGSGDLCPYQLCYQQVWFEWFFSFPTSFQSCLTREQALVKLWMDNVPLTGAEKHACLQIVWDNEHMQSFADFFKWYNIKDLVPTLEAMQILVEFYHNKKIDFLELGCTLPTLAKLCLPKSTVSIFYPFTITDKDITRERRRGYRWWTVRSLYT